MASRQLQNGIENSADAVKTAARQAKASLEDVHGPSPNMATNLAIADIALRAGSVLARQAVETAFLGRKYSGRKAAKILKGRTLSETVLHSVLARVALRSVPGAIVVGGALVAKTLYDRSKAHRAAHEGEVELEKRAAKGKGG